MPPSLQESMRALRVLATGAAPTVEVRRTPVPWPGPGQVLVRMHAAPIHNADVAFCRGTWGLRRPLPATPGVEGMGEVVSSGGGIVGRWLVGRRVAVLARPDGDGTWAEYVATDASLCMPIGPAVSDRQGATLLFNPLTAIAAVDLARASSGAGVIVTGASGALGRMIVRLGRR
ncbi:MAG TPA: alcohol dehydrogenase catalytic domain-containing protein, partial [Myxococcota bacterium]|nr:alcohol dehydrogenase catalytic domain-containing protein [Myxococcota bacterium]